MRINSYPPFIVFFDTLAVILFFLLLKQFSPTEIIFNGNELPRNATITYLNNPDESRSHNGVEILLNCEDVPQCRSLSVVDSRNAVVKLAESTVIEVAKARLLAIDNGCGSLTVFIDDEGKLDRKKMIDADECLGSVSRIDNWLKEEGR